MSGFTISKHAEKRMRQRGIKNADLLSIYAHADQIFPVGSGCNAIRFSKKMKKKQEKSKLISNFQKLKNMVLIIDDFDLVVTVFIDYGGKHGRRYRNA